jgi:hypothetical protein
MNSPTVAKGVSSMDEHKDYLGDKLRLMEKAREDVYFRKINQELVEKLRQQNAEDIEAAIRDYVRLRCPKCGEPLQEITHEQLTIDECSGCGGVWLDKEAFEALLGPKHEGWLVQFYETFIPPKP